MNILIAPLDWGLGHASRCIPIIRALAARGHHVSLAGSGESLELIKREFPSLGWFDLPGYNVRYAGGKATVWKLIHQLPKFLKVMAEEHTVVEAIVEKQKIALVISDNRYGCWSKRVPSVIITHQTTIPVPRYLRWAQRLIGGYNRKLIYRFTQCWIPDFPGAHSLAGRLSRFSDSAPDRFRYIGNLSRFDPVEPSITPRYDFVALLSGPEPQRTRLEELILAQLPKTPLRAFVVRGTMHPPRPLPEGVEGADFPDAASLQRLMEQTNWVIARSGYSTIMDLAKLGKKAIFIPTPGQPEQEYLARRLKKMKLAYSASQRQFSLKRAWRASRSYTGFHFTSDRFTMLEYQLDGLAEWTAKHSMGCVVGPIACLSYMVV